MGSLYLGDGVALIFVDLLLLFQALEDPKDLFKENINLFKTAKQKKRVFIADSGVGFIEFVKFPSYFFNIHTGGAPLNTPMRKESPNKYYFVFIWSLSGFSLALAYIQKMQKSE